MGDWIRDTLESWQEALRVAQQMDPTQWEEYRADIAALDHDGFVLSYKRYSRVYLTLSGIVHPLMGFIDSLGRTLAEMPEGQLETLCKVGDVADDVRQKYSSSPFWPTKLDSQLADEIRLLMTKWA